MQNCGRYNIDKHCDISSTTASLWGISKFPAKAPTACPSQIRQASGGIRTGLGISFSMYSQMTCTWCLPIGSMYGIYGDIYHQYRQTGGRNGNPKEKGKPNRRTLHQQNTQAHSSFVHLSQVSIAYIVTPPGYC